MVPYEFRNFFSCFDFCLIITVSLLNSYAYVEVEFYPGFKFSSPLFEARGQTI